MANNYSFKQKALSFATAFTLLTGTGYVVLKPEVAIASVKDFNVKYDEEKGEYVRTYTVQEGDTASKISSFLVGSFIREGEVPQEDREFFKEDENRRCSFWPAIVKYHLDTENEKRAAEGKGKITKFRIQPGQIIEVPSSYEELKSFNVAVKRSGWYSNYLQANNIYPKQKKYAISKDEAERLIQEAYRYIDPEHTHELSDAEIEAYLRLVSGTNIKFTIKEDSAPLDREGQWYFYEGIPTPEEVEAEMGKSKTKTR